MTSEESWIHWVGIENIDVIEYVEYSPSVEFIEIRNKLLEQYPAQARNNGTHVLSESVSIFVHHSTEIVAISIDGVWSFLNKLYERIVKKELNLTKA